MKKCHVFCFFGYHKKILLLVVSFFLIFSVFRVNDVKGAFHQELFEPLNSIILAESYEVVIPFVAGWICDGSNTLFLNSIDIYALHDEDKDYISTYSVGEPLYSCYMDEYMDFGGDTYYVKNVEPTCKYDEETETYYVSYKDTLKEAIGYAQGSEPSEDWFEFNENTLNKVYHSLYEQEMIILDMRDLFEEFNVDTDYVIVLQANFIMDGTNPIAIDREVTIYSALAYETEELTSLEPPQDINGAYDRRYREALQFYKGDGHLHSNFSDGKGKTINHPVPCQRNAELASIAHFKREMLDCDWLIMTDHADYFFDGQKQGKGNPWFLQYNNACDVGDNSAQYIERNNETTSHNYKSWYTVVPAEELTVRTTETDCFSLQKPTGSGFSDVLNYYGIHLDQPNKVAQMPNWGINGTGYC